jgi:hypothetical protein
MQVTATDKVQDERADPTTTKGTSEQGANNQGSGAGNYGMHAVTPQAASL